MHLEELNVTELFVHYHAEKYVEQNKRMKIKIYFRPKESKEYEFKLRFWVNSLCEEIVIIRGEGEKEHKIIYYFMLCYDQ